MKKHLIVLLSIAFACTAYAGEKEGNPLFKGEFVKKAIKLLTDPMEKVIGPVVKLGEIVVSPTRTPEKIGASSSSVTAQWASDFNKKKISAIKEALKDEQGLDVVKNGPFGGSTSVFMRGANSNHTQVMVDGIRLYDVMSPNAAYNFAHLTTTNVESIEVLRGAQSALYGSDAIGGVININTKKATEPFFKASFESGSFYTLKESVELGSTNNGFHYTMGFLREDTKGISKAEAKNNRPENDPYSLMSFSTRADYDIFDTLTTGLTARHTRNVNELDLGPNDDPNYYEKTFESIYTGYVEHEAFDWWDYSARVAWMENERRYFDDNDGIGSAQVDYQRSWYTGYLFKFDYQNNFHVFDIDTLTIGYEFTKEIGDSWGDYNGALSDMNKVFSHSNAFYVSNRLNYQDRLTLTTAMRVDKHSNAGTHTVWKCDSSYLLPFGMKLRGAWATGFKAPTLYQMHAPAFPGFWGWYIFDGGNINLQPEKSINWELGVDQYLWGENVIASCTYFYNVYRDLIGTRTIDPATFHTSAYLNIGKAFSRGVEASVIFRPLETVDVSANYTYMRTEDTDTDAPLLRRANRKCNVAVDWDVSPKLNVYFGLNYVGPRFDINSDKLKEYYYADFVLSYDVTDNMEVYGKLENVFDYKYQEVRNYGTSGIAAYGGVKAKF